MSLFHRFREPQSGATSYLIGSAEAGLCLLIDPIPSCLPFYGGMFDELDLRLACIFQTHRQPEAARAVGELRQMTGASLASGRPQENPEANISLDDGDELKFGDLRIRSIATPGYTRGCTTYAWEDRLFTGQSLLIGRWNAKTHPETNPGLMFQSITRQLMSHADETLLYPGLTTAHRWVSCIGEERRANPMFRGMSRDEFITLYRQGASQSSPEQAFEALPTLS